jgi:hypothetical protein
VVLAPEEPMFYVGGDLAGLITGGLVDDAAFGFSLDGRIPFTPQLPFWTGEALEEVSIEGHVYAQGSVQLGRLPLSVAGAFCIDADADDDGATIFEGDARDVILAGDSSLSIGYSKAGFDLSLEIARSSWMYDGREGPVGAAYFHSNTSAGLGDLFAGTPLEALSRPGSEVDFYGTFRDTDDFKMHWSADVRVMTLDVAEAVIELTPEGAMFRGLLQPVPFIHDAVEITGRLGADGTFELTGVAQLSVGGYDLVDGQARVTQAGLGLSGRLDLPAIGSANVSGAVNGHEAFLRGRANLSPGGFNMANAQVDLNTQGAAIQGEVGLPGFGNVYVSGSVPANGQFALTVRGALRPLGIALADAAVTVRSDGARVEAHAGYGGTGFNVSGDVQSNGQFSLTGRSAVRTGVLNGNIDLTLAHSGVRAEFAGQVCMPVSEQVCHQECDSWGFFSFICDGWNTVCETVTSVECLNASGTVDSTGTVCLNTPVGRRCLPTL